MHRVLFILALTLGLISMSCDAETRAQITGNAKGVTVVIEGTAPEYHGSIGSGGSQRSVSGSVPASLTLAGANSNGVLAR